MEVASKTVSPIIFVLLARLLSPEDFGVLATAMIAISFSQMFWDAGLSKALIQTKQAPKEAANVVFWTNLLLGILIYIVFFVAAPAIAQFFRSPAAGPVLRVLGVQIVIASLSSVQQALFVRDLDFRGLFWIRLLTVFVPGLFSVPLALFGYGVWALVGGSLAGQMLNLWLLWRRSPWRPSAVFDMSLARKLFGFGYWVLLESLGAWIIVWGDNLIVGRFLGVHDLGVYRTGWMLTTIIFGLVLNPFLPVLYPTFSRLQDDLVHLKSAFDQVNRVVFALALPIAAGLFLVGHEVVLVFFGAKWQGLGFVLGVLGLMHGLGWLVGLNAELYRAIGRPDLNTKLLYFAILYYLPAYFFSAQYGLESFTITRFAVALVAIPIHIYLCVKMLAFPPNYIWKQGKPMIISTLVMVLCVSGLKWGLLPAIPEMQTSAVLCMLIGSGVTVYFACLWVLDRGFVLQTRSLLKRANTAYGRIPT